MAHAEAISFWHNLRLNKRRHLSGRGAALPRTCLDAQIVWPLPKLIAVADRPDGFGFEANGSQITVTCSRIDGRRRLRPVAGPHRKARHLKIAYSSRVRPDQSVTRA